MPFAWFAFGHLRLAPIVVKNTGADHKDLADIRFLLHTHRPDHEAITAIVRAFPSAARECAVENLVYLAIL